MKKAAPFVPPSEAANFLTSLKVKVMQNAVTPFGHNIFAEAFRRFDEEAFFQNLENRVKPLPYFTKYKGFKDTLLWLSYLFNLFSILSASYAVYYFTEWITGFVAAGWITAGVFLFFLEKLKRKSSTEFWQVYFFERKAASGWLVLSLFCLSLSLLSSAFGSKKGTEELAPSAELLAADSIATDYRQKVKELEAENAELKGQKDHTGTIYYNLQSVIRSNTSMIADYQNRILELDKKLEGKNEQLSSAYRQKIEFTAWTLVWVVIVMELLFEACIAYVWYYYHRSYVERKMLQSGASGNDLPEEELDLTLATEVENLKQELAAMRETRSSMAQIPAETQTEPYENGQPKNETRPLGFYTDAQLVQHGYTPRGITKNPHTTCTHMYTETKYEDRYTVKHFIQERNGKKRLVRYTLTQVENRIADYQARVGEAITKGMSPEVLQNRRNWLDYWQKKREELLQKCSAEV